jgi:tetratricopeptide (TPR) repeat protein
MNTSGRRGWRRAVAALMVSAAAAAVSGCAFRSAAAPDVAVPAPTVTSSSPSIEATDQRLAGALKALAARADAATHRAVAREFHRLGVLDRAHEHYTEAARRDPQDVSSFDALARIWRDWGVPHLGVADAHRAVRLAPRSAVAASTLGTVLEAMGQRRLARQWYAHAIALDGTAAFALNNFCYVTIMLEQPDAVQACRRAVAGAPRSTVARNNLALAYAAAGDMKSAREQFMHAGHAAADYNIGILHMAMREYRAAAGQFAAALQANPESTQIARRAQQARLAAESAEGTR